MSRRWVQAVVLVILATASVASARQPIGTLQVKVTLVDAAGATIPVARHLLLISDNPATIEPRRVLTGADGTAVVRLRPGNYTVESDRAVALNGQAYRWTQILDVVSGREITLELNVKNADVEAASAEPSAAAPEKTDSSMLLTQWQDSVVVVWMPTARASGFVADPRGLIVTSQRAIGNERQVEVQITSTVKVAATVVVADLERDVAVLRIDRSAAESTKPVPLHCAEPAKVAVRNGQEVFTIGAPIRGPKVLESGELNRVTARTMAADFELATAAVGGPVFTDSGEVIGLASLPNERDDSVYADSRIVRLLPLCEAIESATQQLATAAAPPSARLPVEPTPLSRPMLEKIAERHGGDAKPYSMSTSDFDVTFITPVLLEAADKQSTRAGPKSGALPVGSAGISPLIDFANWSEYVADSPPVLLIRVTPRLVEGFWTKVARAAVMTKGVVLPPIKRFTSGFLRLRAFCGNTEVTPIHPFRLIQRLSETEAIHEGLYAFDPASLGRACGTIRLELFSEKDATRGEARTFDAKVLDSVWRDFETLLR